MKTYEFKTKKTKDLKDTICNKCGNSCILEHNIGGFTTIVDGCYDSKYLEDGSSVVFDICEKCAKEFIDTFVIPAENFF